MPKEEPVKQGYCSFKDLGVRKRFIPAQPGTDLFGKSFYRGDGSPRVLIKTMQLNEGQRYAMHPGDSFNADACDPDDPQQPQKRESFAIGPDLIVIPLPA